MLIYLTIESIPLFSDNSRPTIETSFRISWLENLLSKSILERVQIAIDELGFPLAYSSGIGNTVLHISPTISANISQIFLYF